MRSTIHFLTRFTRILRQAKFPVVIPLALACQSAVLAEADGVNNPPPNIIFIFADDWGYSDLGIHGSTFCKTPRLDQMAAEGTDFQEFTVNNPVCSPSRTAVMTGHFPARHSVHQHFASIQHHQRASMPDWLDPQAPMLPRMLKEAGYATAHFGKWHLSNDHIKDAPLPPEYGYDEYGAFNLPSSASEQMPTVDTWPRTIDFIKRHRDQPFFLNVWIHETHTPFYPQEKYMLQFAHLDEQQQVYAAVVAEADTWIGRILDTLKELGIDERTLVIFSSDNGPEWATGKNTKLQQDASTGPGLGRYYSVGERHPMKGQKRSLYAGGIRVPFIARWPGTIPAGRIDRESVLTAVDLLPTFLEVAAVPLPQGYKPDGESILDALTNGFHKRTKPIFWEWRANQDHPQIWPHLGMREGPWKLLWNESLDRIELYNIEEDWAEASNMADRECEVVAKMKNKILEWKATLPTEPPAHCFSTDRN